jgi:hypothetical protein
MAAPVLDARLTHTHQAIAEALGLEVAGVAASLALVCLFADLLATSLLERLALAVVSCLRPRRG